MSESLPVRALIGSPAKENRQNLSKLRELMERLMQPTDPRDLAEWRQFASVRVDLVVLIGASAPKHVILSRVPDPSKYPEVYRNLLATHQADTYLDVDPQEAGEGFVCAKISGVVREANMPVLGWMLDLPDLEAALRPTPEPVLPTAPKPVKKAAAAKDKRLTPTENHVLELFLKAAEALADSDGKDISEIEIKQAYDWLVTKGHYDGELGAFYKALNRAMRKQKQLSSYGRSAAPLSHFYGR